MAYRMPSPEDVERLRVNAFYILYNPSAHVLNYCSIRSWSLGKCS